MASHADIKKEKLIDFIINGFQDSVGTVLFFTARSIEVIKRLLPRYEQRRQHLVTVKSKSTISRSNISTNLSSGSKLNEKSFRCYKCSEYGHISSQCTKNKRTYGSCFNCHEVGHSNANCPKRAITTATNIITEETLEKDISLAEM